MQVLEDTYYRGIVNVTVRAKGGDYKKRILVDGAETQFHLKVPTKPLEVALNKDGEILAHDVKVNEPW